MTGQLITEELMEVNNQTRKNNQNKICRLNRWKNYGYTTRQKPSIDITLHNRTELWYN